MSLTILFALLAVGLAVFFLAFALVVQNYLSGQPASLLPVRAVIAGVLVAGFLAMWVSINSKAKTKDQYGTLFEFRSTSTVPLENFTAIRKYVVPAADGKIERRVKVAKTPQGFIEAPDVSKPFKLNSSDWLVVAVEVQEEDKTIRFDAELFNTVDGKTRPATPEDKDVKFGSSSAQVFRDKESGRFIEFENLRTPGPINSPSSGSWWTAILLNLGHLLVWLLAFWPILRFSFGTAIGMSIGFWAATMFFLMPILFDKGRPANPPQAQRSAPCWQRNAA